MWLTWCCLFNQMVFCCCGFFFGGSACLNFFFFLARVVGDWSYTGGDGGGGRGVFDGINVYYYQGPGRARTRDRKVGNLNPSRSSRRIFFWRVNLVCWLLLPVPSIPVLPQWHIKDPGHSAQSAGGRLHLNTNTPLTQRSRSGLTRPLCRHSAETYQETSSHATHQGTLGHSRLSSLSHCGLILA